MVALLIIMNWYFFYPKNYSNITSEIEISKWHSWKHIYVYVYIHAYMHI